MNCVLRCSGRVWTRHDKRNKEVLIYSKSGKEVKGLHGFVFPVVSIVDFVEIRSLKGCFTNSTLELDKIAFVLRTQVWRFSEICKISFKKLGYQKEIRLIKTLSSLTYKIVFSHWSVSSSRTPYSSLITQEGLHSLPSPLWHIVSRWLFSRSCPKLLRLSVEVNPIQIPYKRTLDGLWTKKKEQNQVRWYGLIVSDLPNLSFVNKERQDLRSFRF